jgi:predicted amidohydrolase
LIYNYQGAIVSGLLNDRALFKSDPIRIDWDMSEESRSPNVQSLPSRLRVAGVSWGVRPISHVDQFFEHLTTLVKGSHAQGARLVVLPELFQVELLSLFGDGPEAAVVGHLLPFCDQIDLRLKELASELGVWIIGGSHLRPSPAGPINVATIAWPSGDLFYQPKNCRTMWEREPWRLAPQTGLTSFPDRKLGVLVCYDSEFPEGARALAEHGTELLCVPSYCESQHGYQRVGWSCQARAIENEIFVVHTSLVGPIERFSLGTGYGRSSIIAPSKAPFPDSAILSQSALNVEGIAVADIDFSALTTCRASGDARPWSDRHTSEWRVSK